MPRLLKWGLILPLALLPLVLLEQHGWWRALVLLVGSYGVLVLGTITGWILTDLAERWGATARLAVRACVGMALLYAIFALIWIAEPPTRKIVHFLADWKVLLAAVVFGVCYAIPPPSRWGRRQHKGNGDS